LHKNGEFLICPKNCVDPELFLEKCITDLQLKFEIKLPESNEKEYIRQGFGKFEYKSLLNDQYHPQIKDKLEEKNKHNIY
jgi:hypothetical protein